MGATSLAERAEIPTTACTVGERMLDAVMQFAHATSALCSSSSLRPVISSQITPMPNTAPSGRFSG